MALRVSELSCGHSSKVYNGWSTREDSIGFNARESISNYIVQYMYKTDSGCELRNAIKMASLTR